MVISAPNSACRNRDNAIHNNTYNLFLVTRL